jgi:hypothetical protein
MLFLVVQLSACASISKGITQAFIESKDKDSIDTRECTIVGQQFSGLKGSLENQRYLQPDDTNHSKRTSLKVLMIHGIGDHLQGYSTRLAENMAHALELDVFETRSKELDITSPRFPEEHIGDLRVRRFTNKSEDRELLFYELTWSVITRKEKEILAYDNSGESSFRRANVNNMMKKFLNSHFSDPLIYLGDAQKKIQTAVTQSLCWMTSKDWNELGELTEEFCDVSKPYVLSKTEDDYVFITHSMGSRIAIDSFQAMVVDIENAKVAYPDNERLKTATQTLQSMQIPVFMLANQLPLLQLGRDVPEVTNQHNSYCSQDAPMWDQRFISGLDIIAFSDPNDILSYTVQPRFIDEYMDSRLCASLVNVTINIAEVADLWGVGEVANPRIAHGDYDNDPRVVNIIANGIGNENTSPLVEERCTWLEAR